MQIRHDKQADAIYIKLDKRKVATSQEALTHQVILNLDADGHLVGIEILDVSLLTDDIMPAYIELDKPSG